MLSGDEPIPSEYTAPASSLQPLSPSSAAQKAGPSSILPRGVTLPLRNKNLSEEATPEEPPVESRSAGAGLDGTAKEVAGSEKEGAAVLEDDNHDDAWSSLDTMQLLRQNEEEVRRLLEECGPIGDDSEEGDDGYVDADDDLYDDDIDLNDDEDYDDLEVDDDNVADTSGHFTASPFPPLSALPSDEGGGAAGAAAAAAATAVPEIAIGGDLRRAAWGATAAIERALGCSENDPADVQADLRTPREALDEANRALAMMMEI
jgi:hypothetical protein